MPRKRVPDLLTIRVSGRGDDVPLTSLLNVLRESLAILREIDAGIAGAGKPTLRWDVADASVQSPLAITIAGRPLNDTPSLGVAAAFSRGLASLDRGAKTPEYFTDATVNHAKKLVNTLDDGVATIAISVPGMPVVEPTQRVAANVDEILRDEYQEVESDLMGIMEILNVHGNLKFTIYDPIDGHGTICYFDDEHLGAAAAAIRKRVIVKGLAKFNRLGRPVSVKVKEPIEVIDSDAAYQFREGEEIDLTGGMESGDYIRRLRDGD